ncbi:MAG: hypothetical protein V7607_186 [Solirubrobacteraceae bacterium]
MSSSTVTDRVNAPISTTELERRLSAIRAAMERERVDVLVMQGNSQEVGCYVKYVTDVPAGGYGTAVVLPREDEMTVVMHGPAGQPRVRDEVLRGVGCVLTSPFFPSAVYTAGAPAQLALEALAGYERAVIGLVGTAQMSLAFGETVKAALRDATFVEASELVDRVKAIKSDEEQELIRACARLQDAAMQAAFGAVAPGVRESDIAAVAQQVASGLGSEAGIVLIGSGPAGGGWTIGPRHLQNRVVEDGDMVALLVEVNGPGGLYAELGRTAILGDAPARLEEELELVLEAQRFTLERLVPGASCAEAWDAYNELLRERGRPIEQRVHCHGQGVDLVERPLIRFDETMSVEAGMNITCHPTWVHDGLWSWICDNYLIGPDGPGACLHAFPQRITAL